MHFILCIHTCYSAHCPRGFSVVDYIKYLSYLLSLTVHTCLTHLSILTHPVNFPCGSQRTWKPENSEKSHNFRQSVDELFPRVIRCKARTHDLSVHQSPQSITLHSRPTVQYGYVLSAMYTICM